MQRVCDKHNPAYYPRFKQWADEYFYCKHRDQRRGLGGIFFDDLNDRPQDEVSVNACLDFVSNFSFPLVVWMNRWQVNAPVLKGCAMTFCPDHMQTPSSSLML